MGDFDALFSGKVESPMKHHPFIILTLTSTSGGRTLSGGQFEWGARLKNCLFSVLSDIFLLPYH